MKVIPMRGTLITAIATPLIALAIAGTTPSLAAPAAAALAYGKTDAGIDTGLVEQVGKKYRYSKRWRRGPYYRGYAYRPYYYRPYAYWGPRYYWGYPYYYRRPGFSIWLGW
jgi:hypothetical protein